MASTARLNLTLSESDEISRQDVADIEQAVTYVEKYDAVINLAGNASAVEVSPPQMASGKLLVARTLKDGDTVTVRINADDEQDLLLTSLLVLNASAITKLFLDNTSSDPVKVRVSLYGDA